MSRTGSLVVGALVFALAAVGVLVWTNNLDAPFLTGPSRSPTSSATPAAGSSSQQSELSKIMSEATSSGGYAATFSEQDIKLWKIGAGHRVERFSFQGENTALARVTSTVALGQPTTQWEELGLSIRLPTRLSEDNKGYAVEVGIVARQPSQNASDAVSVVFATQQTGNSGWNTLPLSRTFELRTFKWTIPPIEGAYSVNPILVINADASGQGKAIEILGVYVKPAR
jgi:hypothetical protein